MGIFRYIIIIAIIGACNKFDSPISISNKKAFHYLGKNLDSCLYYITQSENSSDFYKNSKLRAETYYILSNVYYRKMMIDSSNIYLDSCFILYDTTDTRFKTELMFIKGNLLFSNGKLDESIDWYNKCYLTALKDSNINMMISSLMNKAIVFENQNKHFMRLITFAQLDDYITKSNSLRNKIYYYISRSWFSYEDMELDETIKYARLSNSYAKKTSQKDLKAANYLNLGKVHTELNNLDSAFYYCQKALNLFKEADLIDDMAYVYTSMSKIMYKKNIFDSALTLIDKATKIHSNIMYDHEAIEFKILSLIKLGKKNIANQELEKYKKSNDKFYSKTLFNKLKYKLFKSISDNKNTLKSLELYSHLKDSLLNKNSRTERSQYRAYYINTMDESKKILNREKNETLKLKIKSQNNYIIYQYLIVLITLITLILVTISLVRIKNKRKRIKAISERYNNVLNDISRITYGPIKNVCVLTSGLYLKYKDINLDDRNKMFEDNIELLSNMVSSLKESLSNHNVLNGKDESSLKNTNIYDLTKDTINEYFSDKSEFIKNSLHQKLIVKCNSQSTGVYIKLLLDLSVVLKMPSGLVSITHGKVDSDNVIYIIFSLSERFIADMEYTRRILKNFNENTSANKIDFRITNDKVITTLNIDEL